MKRIFAIAVILTLASADIGLGNTFLGQVEIPHGRQLEAISNTCAKVVTDIKILDVVGKVLLGISPATYEMEVYIDQDLKKCYAGYQITAKDKAQFVKTNPANGGDIDEQTQEGIYHRVFFTRRDNSHDQPNNPNNLPLPNVLPKMDTAKFSDRKVHPVKFATEAAEKAAGPTDFAYEIWRAKEVSLSILNGKTHQCSWDEFVRTDVAGDAAIKHSFSYTFNNPMIEHLQTNEFYPVDVPVKNDKGGYEFEELKVYLMHTIWLATTKTSGSGTNNQAQKETVVLDPTLSRWFEWFITVQTYTTLKPANSKQATVIPVEIKAPVCDNCVMTVSHSAVVEFYEERVTTHHCYPEFNCKAGSTHINKATQVSKVAVKADEGVKYRETKDCDWTNKRDGLVFESLSEPVCMGISLKDKTTSRAFVLQRFTYGYNGQRVSSKTLYDKFKDINSPSLQRFKFDNKLKMLQLRFVLKLGAVQELMYQAAVKLCKVTGTFQENVCDGVTAADAAPGEADDLTATALRLRQRMLEGHEPSRRRWLAAKDALVVQQYTSEQSQSGQAYQAPQTIVVTKESSSGGAMAVVGGVVALAVIGGIGFAVWKFGCQAKNAGGNGGNVPQQSQPNNNMQPTNNAV